MGSNSPRKVKVSLYQLAVTSLTTTGTHVPYEIIQCYLLPGRGTLPKPRLVLDFTFTEGCKAEFTWWLVEVDCPSKDGHPSQHNRAVSYTHLTLPTNREV